MFSFFFFLQRMNREGACSFVWERCASPSPSSAPQLCWYRFTAEVKHPNRHLTLNVFGSSVCPSTQKHTCHWVWTLGSGWQSTAAPYVQLWWVFSSRRNNYSTLSFHSCHYTATDLCIFQMCACSVKLLQYTCFLLSFRALVKKIKINLGLSKCSIWSSLGGEGGEFDDDDDDEEEKLQRLAAVQLTLDCFHDASFLFRCHAGHRQD